MATKKKNTQSENGDTTIRRYTEEQDSAPVHVDEEFTGTERIPRWKSTEWRTRKDVREKHLILSGGDPDAILDTGSYGDETVGGSNPTPDQDNVDELGAAVGLTFEDSEELGGAKVYDRDIYRWELDPASSEDYEERIKGYR
ncbi:MAG TPA: DUF6335 family protein [Nitrospirales bacterium]|nr:DUF6335 family protein [Nitrospirales bacterium]